VCAGGQIHGTTLGLGAHIWDIPLENMTKMAIVRSGAGEGAPGPRKG